MRILAVAALAAICSGAALAEESKPFDLSGYFDLYYQYDFNRPTVGTSPFFEENLRQFDVRSDHYRLATAWLDISHAPTEKSPLGFYATLLAGDTADIISFLEPGGRENWKNIGQAYASYKTFGKVPLTFDFGKFWTGVGYEVVDQRADDNYSRGLNYYTNQPIYHTGLRVTAPVASNLTLMGMVVQGWNEVADSNGAKSFHGLVTYTATPKLTFTLDGFFGKEGADDADGISGFGPATTTDVSLIDAIVVYQSDPTLKLALNADYLDSKGMGKSNGIAVYARKTLNARSAAAFRGEHVEDLDGFRTGFATTYNTLTGTYDYNVGSNLTLRFEVRHDMAGEAAFNSDAGLKKERTTLTFAQVIKF